MNMDNSGSTPWSKPKDPVRLALDMVDQTLQEVSAAERRQTWAGLLAASVPHWLDLALFAALCETTSLEAEGIFFILRRLPCIKPVHARGEGAFQIDDSIRVPLRGHLRTWHPDRWQRLSRHACAHFKKRGDSSSAIEALYHRFASNLASAAWECQALGDYFRDYRLNAEQTILGEVLTELITANWLSGPALVEAWLGILWIRALRGETGQLKREARKVLALATEVSPPARIADAWILMGDLRMTQERPGVALAAYHHAESILKSLITQDPWHLTWCRELAITYSKTGLAHQSLGSILTSHGTLEKSRILLENLCAKSPGHPGRQRELAAIVILLQDLHACMELWRPWNPAGYQP